MFQMTVRLVGLVVMMGCVIFCCLVMVFSDEFLVRCLYLDLLRFKTNPISLACDLKWSQTQPKLYSNCTLAMIFSDFKSFPDHVWSADVEVGQPCSVFPVRTFSY